MSKVPLAAVMAFPFTVRVTFWIALSAMNSLRGALMAQNGQCVGDAVLPIGAGTAVQMCFKIFAEFLYEADDRHSRCIAERAKGSAQHVFGEVLHVLDILCHSSPGVESL